MRTLIIGAIRSYQLMVSPWLPASCRYEPSCSEYALTAVRRLGVTRGLWLSAHRLLRCQPFGSQGYDPVPGAEG